MLEIFLNYMKERFKEPSTWKGLIALIAAIVMYFTPDEIDHIIMLALGLIGITDIVKNDSQQ